MSVSVLLVAFLVALSAQEAAEELAPAAEAESPNDVEPSMPTSDELAAPVEHQPPAAQVDVDEVASPVSPAGRGHGVAGTLLGAIAGSLLVAGVALGVPAGMVVFGGGGVLVSLGVLLLASVVLTGGWNPVVIAAMFGLYAGFVTAVGGVVLTPIMGLLATLVAAVVVPVAAQVGAAMARWRAPVGWAGIALGSCAVPSVQVSVGVMAVAPVVAAVLFGFGWCCGMVEFMTGVGAMIQFILWTGAWGLAAVIVALAVTLPWVLAVLSMVGTTALVTVLAAWAGQPMPTVSPATTPALEADLAVEAK